MPLPPNPARLRPSRPSPNGPTARRLLVRARQAEDVLGDKAEDEIGGNGRDLVQARLAELSLYLVLRRKPVPSVRLEAHVRGLPRRLGGQHLGHVGLRAARLALVEERRRALHHETGRLDRRVRLGDGERHALVLPNRSVEHLALVGVSERTNKNPKTLRMVRGWGVVMRTPPSQPL